MLNPITLNKKYLIGYYLFWMVVSVIQAAVLYFLLHNSLWPSILDAVVFNMLLSLLGLAIWPIVNFSSLERVFFFNTIFTHLAGATVLVAIWLGASWALLNMFLAENEIYFTFLQSSVFWRIAQGIFIYMLFALNYYAIIYSEESKVRKVNEADLRRTLKEAELNVLKSQLNPHFIFNSLNSISSLTLTDPDKAQEMVIALSEFLRYSIKPDHSKMIKLKDELAAIEKFLLIEKVRFGDRLELKIECSAACKETMLPPLIIQPLVENAVKYGVHETLDRGVVSINCSCSSNMLEIEVKNTFHSEEDSMLKTGVGLDNVRNRLSLLFDSDELLKISANNEYFKVKLIIPQ